ncbi:hypothetical protein GCM10023203_08020 [Actinomycetospora straminea]|uniref:Uncharacterized protein n=1 Tax=Actinomycetospora straminea TaxID=663607 RepID=A0ABP9E197_9PSEU
MLLSFSADDPAGVSPVVFTSCGSGVVSLTGCSSVNSGEWIEQAFEGAGTPCRPGDTSADTRSVGYPAVGLGPALWSHGVSSVRLSGVSGSVMSNPRSSGGVAVRSVAGLPRRDPYGDRRGSDRPARR